jgi:nucleoside-diphosphate-sugar epimerase
MRVFVTGATGYVGGAVVRRLLAEGHAVSGLARSGEAEARLDAEGCEVVRGTLEDGAVLASAARAADAVVHAGATGRAGQDAVDRAAVDALLRGLAGRGGALVYTSGLWVLGDTGGRVAAEDAPLAPAALVAWRAEVERRVLGAPGVRGVVVRPGLVYGRGGGIPGGMVASGRKRGVVRYVGDGAQRVNPVHVDDLAELYLLALGAPAGTVLHGAAETVSTREVAEAAAAAAGVPPSPGRWRRRAPPSAPTPTRWRWTSGSPPRWRGGWDGGRRGRGSWTSCGGRAGRRACGAGRVPTGE